MVKIVEQTVDKMKMMIIQSFSIPFRKIDQEEFLGQYIDDANNPPEWVLDDRKHFREKLDKNKNGMLEREEMKKWVRRSFCNYLQTQATNIKR